MTTDFYTDVEQEINKFVHRCQNVTAANPSTPSSIACLTPLSHDTLTLATERLDTCIDRPETSLDGNAIIAIVGGCSSLVQTISTHQCYLIEYALDDYLLLDEHVDLIYRKTVHAIEHLHRLPVTHTDVYNLSQQLHAYLPSTYASRISSVTLTDRITSTLIAHTSRLFSSSYHSLVQENEDDDNDCVLPPSFLFSSSPSNITNEDQEPISSHQRSDSFIQYRSMLQLDKINVRTTNLSHSQTTPSLQFDLTDFEQIENDLYHASAWMRIERAFFVNVISVWCSEQSPMQTINPWSSETFWTVIGHFQCSDMNLKYEVLFVIQWCFCSLAIQAFNRDWDSFYSQALVNIIVTNRWRTVAVPDNHHLSIVGHDLNQMLLRLARNAAILQYMNVLAEQSSRLTSYFTNLIASNVKTLSQQIEATFQLFIVWLAQRADAFINGNTLERALLVCKSDHMQISTSVNHLIGALRQLHNCTQSLRLVTQLHSSCETIVTDTMAKLYRRIQANTTRYFDDELPPTANEWRMDHQPNAYMIAACNRILQPMFHQTESLSLEKKSDIHEHVLQAFLHAWTTVLLEKKYRFCEELVHILQKDYDYLLSFLSTSVSDQDTRQALYSSPAIQEITSIIRLLRTGDKSNSVPSLPHQDKWLHSRKSSPSLLECFQSVCCCHRRNRVTTGPS